LNWKSLEIEDIIVTKIEIMKSSYELAMERMGGDDNPLTDTQKEQIAEIESKYKAKIAERKIFLEKNLQDALAQGNQQEAEEARKILAKETLKLEEKAESEKEKIRKSS
jgi:flagellar biosynthesis/type III secretory pathway protein FliH